MTSGRGISRRIGLVAALALLHGAAAPGSLRGQGLDREVAFLLIPTGARAVGMGRAGAALEADLQAARWNPAVLGSLGDVSGVFSQYDGPLEFRVNQVAVAVSIPHVGVVSLSADVQSFGDIALAESSAPEAVAVTVSPSNQILALGYGRTALGGAVAVGMVAKWVRSELIADIEGSTYALDAGLLWTPRRSLPVRIGVSVINLGPGLRVGEGGGRDPLPGRLRLGAAYDVLEHLRPEGDLRLLVAADLEHAVRDLSAASQYMGVELGVDELLYLRGGFIAETLIETNTGTTIGFGLSLGPIGFDLARELGVNQLGDETHVSLSARI